MGQLFTFSSLSTLLLDLCINGGLDLGIEDASAGDFLRHIFFVLFFVSGDTAEPMNQRRVRHRRTATMAMQEGVKRAEWDEST